MNDRIIEGQANLEEEILQGLQPIQLNGNQLTQGAAAGHKASKVGLSRNQHSLTSGALADLDKEQKSSSTLLPNVDASTMNLRINDILSRTGRNGLQRSNSHNLQASQDQKTGVSKALTMTSKSFVSR